VAGFTIRVSKGEIRRARHLEIIDKAEEREDCIKVIYDIQQLVMKTDCYMLDANEPNGDRRLRMCESEAFNRLLDDRKLRLFHNHASRFYSLLIPVFSTFKKYSVTFTDYE
jgi:hypothetical protein